MAKKRAKKARRATLLGQSEAPPEVDDDGLPLFNYCLRVILRDQWSIRKFNGTHYSVEHPTYTKGKKQYVRGSYEFVVRQCYIVTKKTIDELASDL